MAHFPMGLFFCFLFFFCLSNVKGSLNAKNDAEFEEVLKIDENFDKEIRAALKLPKEVSLYKDSGTKYLVRNKCMWGCSAKIKFRKAVDENGLVGVMFASGDMHRDWITYFSFCKRQDNSKWGHLYYITEADRRNPDCIPVIYDEKTKSFPIGEDILEYHKKDDTDKVILHKIIDVNGRFDKKIRSALHLPNKVTFCKDGNVDYLFKKQCGSSSNKPIKFLKPTDGGQLKGKIDAVDVGFALCLKDDNSAGKLLYYLAKDDGKNANGCFPAVYDEKTNAFEFLTLRLVYHENKDTGKVIVQLAKANRLRRLRARKNRKDQLRNGKHKFVV